MVLVELICFYLWFVDLGIWLCIERCMPVAAIFRLLIDGRTAGTEWIGQATVPAAAAAAELRMIINERFGNGNSVVYTNFQRFTHRYVCIYSRLLVVW